MAHSASPREFVISKNHSSMALYSQPTRICPFKKSYLLISLHTDSPNFSISKNLTSMALYSQATRIIPFQKIIPPWLFSASPREFVPFEKSYLRGSLHTDSPNFSFSKNHSSMALYSQPTLICPFQKIFPPWLSSDRLPEFLHFKKSYLRGSLHTETPNFSISKNLTSMALFTQTPRIIPFQKIIPTWLFSASPREFVRFEKYYLRGSLHTDSPNFSIKKILPPWLSSNRHAEFLHFKKSIIYGSFQPAHANLSL